MKYDKYFFEGHKDGSLSSAREVVPIVMKLVKPKKVVDVGCGTGAWLSVFKEQGADEVLGIDGDWVDRKMLLIPKESFQSANLEKSLEVGKKFELVVSLEVAEHLSENCTQTFINSLVNLGPVILFSAAIPHQGGSGHQNEQWPAYWEKLFAKNGYLPIDCIRKKIWDNKNVSWWYAQNIFLVVKKEFLEINETLKHELAISSNSILPLVHPENYLSKIGFRSIAFAIIPNPILRIIKTIKDLIK
jgi:cyclopropane fatty-acyl-phospholipid synthase-like methyltransferase